MLDMKIAKQSLKFSALAVLYVAIVATFMQNASKIFGPDEPKDIFAPVAFLLLLVVSAATMGMLVFGKPVMLYMDGNKREAVTMVIYNIGSLAASVVFLIVGAALLRG